MKEPSLGDILFLDIETVSGKASYEELSEEFQTLWADKTKYQRGEEYSPDEYYVLRGGILAEFSKIVCISVAFVYTNENGLAINVAFKLNLRAQFLIKRFIKKA